MRRKQKYLIALVWILTIAFVILACRIALAETYRCIVESGQTVNVRAKPSTKASTGGRRLYSGSTIDGDLTEDRQWIHFLDDEGNDAYVMSKYMEIPYVAMCTVSANGRVRWRKTPGGKTGGFFQPDDTVYVNGLRLDSKGVWWADTADDSGHKHRFVSLDYLVHDGTLLSDVYN